MKYTNKYFYFLALLIVVSKLNLQAQIKTASHTISITEMDYFLKRQMDSLTMPGLSIAIINNGKIIYHSALGVENTETKKPVTEKSIFEAASLSKPVFAWFVMKMVDKGLLCLDTPLYKYMPYADIEHDDRYKLITARMVLSHQSGFPNWRFFPVDSGLNVANGQLYLKFPPGSQFFYSGEGYLYLGKVLAHLNNTTMQGLESLFEKYVAQPLRMKHSSYIANEYLSLYKVFGYQKGRIEPNNGSKWSPGFPSSMNIDSSYFNPASSLNTNALEYAQFLIALMNDKGLSKKSLQEMLTPQFSYKLSGYFSRYLSWGLGLGILKKSSGTYFEHTGNNGNFQSAFVIDKEKKFGYVFFTNSDKGDLLEEKLLKLLIQEN
jgi:CubicO group peptidase (beta-lactamase class C family)